MREREKVSEGEEKKTKRRVSVRDVGGGEKMLKFRSLRICYFLCSSVKKVIKSGRVRHMSSLFGITVLDTKHTCMCIKRGKVDRES